MKILLVDDDHEISSFVRMAMEDKQHDVDVAFDGLTGNKLAQEKKYDVVILDILLPGIDGFQLCKKIRNSDKEARILLISSLDSYEDKVAAYNYGADNFLTKPFNVSELYSKINAMS